VRRAWIPATVAALLVVALAIAVPRIRNEQAVRQEVGNILHTTDADIVASSEMWLRERGIEPAALLQESSDRGDAYRALRSLLEGMRHERIVATDDDVRQRVRDLVIAASR